MKTIKAYVSGMSAECPRCLQETHFEYAGLQSDGMYAFKPLYTCENESCQTTLHQEIVWNHNNLKRGNSNEVSILRKLM